MYDNIVRRRHDKFFPVLSDRAGSFAAVIRSLFLSSSDRNESSALLSLNPCWLRRVGCVLRGCRHRTWSSRVQHTTRNGYIRCSTAFVYGTSVRFETKTRRCLYTHQTINAQWLLSVNSWLAALVSNGERIPRLPPNQCRAAQDAERQRRRARLSRDNRLFNGVFEIISNTDEAFSTFELPTAG